MTRRSKPVAATESTAKKELAPQLKPFQFAPGQSGNPSGRPKGSRNQLGEDFISALQADFKQHGTEVIETVRTDRPQDYLKVIASILPKEVHVNKSALQELSDDELASILDAVRLQVLSSADVHAGDGSKKASRH